MEGLTDIESHAIETPFGSPSDNIVIGTLEGVRVAFLARHAVGHRILPHELNNRANIFAMKLIGVKWLVSVSACGSLREQFAPGDIVVPTGVFDRTSGRAQTFFGNGLSAHTSLADPFCEILSENIMTAVKATGKKCEKAGGLVVINGPRFSTKTESHIFRQWGLDLINMTTLPEAALAREAEMAYAVMNHVTDYDCWHESEEVVTVDKVIAVLMGNVVVAQKAIVNLVRQLKEEKRVSGAWSGLKDALMTAPALVPEKTRKDLAPLLDKYWGPYTTKK
jgi:5'-methylthioadenosine phosphorylase